MNEEAEREASAYVQTAMSFAGRRPRLTVVGSATKPSVEDLMFPGAARVPISIEEPVRARPLPAIPVGLPEGATLPPMADSLATVAPLPTPAPAAVVAPTRPVAPSSVVDAAGLTGARRQSSRGNYVPIMFVAGVLVLGALVTGRRRRRAWSRS